VSSSGDAVEDTTDATLAWTPLGWEKFHPLWWKIKIGKKTIETRWPSAWFASDAKTT
jgi:hypothetical protein